MIRWATTALLAAILCVGCSGKDFKTEILGEAPPAPEASAASESEQTPPPAPAPAQTAPVASYPLTPPASQPAGQPMSQSAAGEVLVYQVGSFAHRDNAQSLQGMLSERGYACRIEEAQVGGKMYYRVVAEAPGPESSAISALASLGVNEPSLLSRRGSAYAPSPAPAPAAPAPAAPAPVASTPAPAPVAPAPVPAPAPAATAPAASGQPAYAAQSVAGNYPPYCLIDAIRIEAVGKSAGKSDALMARKEASQDAKRNLLVCIDAFKNKGRAVTKSYRVEAYLPDNLVSMGAPVFQSGGGVAVRASIGIADIDSVTINRIE